MGFAFLLKTVLLACLVQTILSNAPSDGSGEGMSSLPIHILEVLSYSITVNWTYCDDFTYEISTHVDMMDNDSKVDMVMNSTDLPFTIDMLSPDTAYKITVTGNSTSGDTSINSTNVSTAPAPPNIGLITPTTNSLFVTWSSVSTAERYVLMYDEMTIKIETLENNYTISGLDSNTKYTIKVQAEIDNCTSTDFSQPKNALTVPDQVMGLTAEVESSEANQTINVMWNSVSGNEMINYTVKYGIVDNKAMHHNTITERDETKLTGLQSGQKYTIRVTASNEGGDSVPSMAVEQCTEPNAPLSFTAIAINLTSVELKLDPPNGVFQVISIEGCDTVNASNLAWNTSERFYTEVITINNLMENRRYTFAVRAICEFGSTQESSEPLIDCGSTVLPPESIMLTAGQDPTTEVNVTIEHQSDQVLFQVIFESNDSIAQEKTISNAASSTLVDGLTPGANYKVSVATVGDDGDFSAYNTSNVVTDPLPVQDLMLQVGSTWIFATWLPPSFNQSVFQNLVLRYRRKDESIDAVNDTQLNTTDNSYNITGLTSGVAYIVQVFTQSYDKNSTTSSAENFTVTDGPGNLELVNHSTKNITIKWNAPKAEFDFYFISYYPESNRSILISKKVSNDTTEYKATNLEPGTPYVFSVVSSGSSNSTATSRQFLTIPLPVRNVSASATSNTSILVTWKVPRKGNYDEFEIQVENGSYVTVNSSTNMTEVQGLDPGTYYIAVIRSVFMGVKSKGKKSKNISTNPGIVDMLQVPSIVSTDTVTITWSAPLIGNADSYSVTLMRDGNSLIRYTSDTSISLSVDRGYEYTVSVVAVLEGLEGEAVAGSFISAPSPVQSVIAVPINSSALRVEWNTPDSGNFDQFEVRIAGADSVLLVSGSSFKAEVNGLNSGTFYTASVRSLLMHVPSSVMNSTNSTTYPGQVLNVTVPNSLASTMFNVTWTKPAGGVDSYEVTLSFNKSSINMTARKPTINLTVEHGFKFTVSVVAVWQKLNGEPDDVTGVVAPLHVTNVFVSANTSSSLNVAWRPPMEGVFDSFFIQAQGEEVDIPVVNQTVQNRSQTSTLLNGLQPGTLYTVTVQSVSFNISSSIKNDTSVARNVPTRPGLVSNLSVPESQNSTLLSITWAGPEAGDVDMYQVRLLGEKIPIINRTNETSLKINVQYGYHYDVSVSAIFRNLTGDSDRRNSSIVPDSVKNLTVAQDQTNRTHSIVVTWESPLGRGDSISVKVLNSVIEITTSFVFNTWSIDVVTVWAIPDVSGNDSEEMRVKMTSANFTSNTTTVENLIPGTNYTVEVTTLSNMLKSEEKQESISTRPASPQLKVDDVSSSNANISWNLTEGNAERFHIVWFLNNGSSIEVGNFNVEADPDQMGYSYFIHTLEPAKNYSVSVFSEITNFTGTFDRSEADMRLFRTPTSKPPPASQPVDSTTAITTPNSFTFTLSAGTFLFTSGAINTYAVFLISDSGQSSEDGPNLNNIAQCITTPGVLTQCVALWTDSNGKSLGDSSSRKKRQTQEQNEDITFEIGTRMTSRRPDSNDEPYENPPLAPGSSYRVSVAGKTANSPEYVATPWSNPIKTQSESTPEPIPTTLIVILVVVILVVIAVVVGGFIFWRRRRQGGKNIEKKEQPTPLKPSSDFGIAVDSKRELQTKARSRSEYLSVFHDFDDEDVSEILSTEYAELRPVGREQSANAAANNRPKNRYTNILPYDATRVKLLAIDDDPGSDYINANFMPGNSSQREYIAAQGPLPATKDDFWRMIWEHNSRDIVMLAKCIEIGKVKCDHYWPHDNDPITVSDMTLQMTSESKNAANIWCTREFKLTRGTSTRVIRHFQYLKWPDHGVPEPEDKLVNFIKYVRQSVDNESKHFGPPTVHCSAGVGRTGTFIAIDRLLQYLDAGATHVDIFGIVYQMRLNRNYMVQTEIQYILIHQVVQDYLNGVYKELDEEPLYDNPAVDDPIYVNTSFSQPANNGNGNGVVNPALISPTDDVPSGKSRHNSQKPLLKPKPSTKPKSATLAGYGNKSNAKTSEKSKSRKPPVAKPRKSPGSTTTAELVPRNESSSDSEDTPVV